METATEIVCVVLNDLTFPVTRQGHATMLDDVGTPTGTMKSILGRSSPQIAGESHLHEIRKERLRAVENVERLALGPRPSPSRTQLCPN